MQLHVKVDTICHPAVDNLLGKIQQPLPVLFDQLAYFHPGNEIHILHPPVVEARPVVAGDKDKDEN